VDSAQDKSPSKAMVLAAGFGTRLRPLTELLPKPLVPLANRPLIHFAFAQLEKAGVRDVVVNSHHLGTKIPETLGASHGLLRLSYSHEAEILGTGGGLVQARDRLESGPFFLLNGDVLSDVDLKAAWEHHRQGNFAATMVVRPLPANSPYTALEADDAGRLVTFKHHRLKPQGATRPCMFCGIHILEPEVFDLLPEQGFSCINNQAYGAMLDQEKEVGAFFYDGPWFDLGTPAHYLQANLDLVSGRVTTSHLPRGCDADPKGLLLGRDLQLGKDVRMGPEVVIGDEAIIGAKAQLRHCVVWPRSRIQDGEILDHCIVTKTHRIQL